MRRQLLCPPRYQSLEDSLARFLIKDPSQSNLRQSADLALYNLHVSQQVVLDQALQQQQVRKTRPDSANYADRE